MFYSPVFREQLMKKQIVIVTEQFDPHTDDVIRALRQMGHEPIRLNTNDIPLNVLISFYITDHDYDGTIKITANGRSIDITDIRSIWWRRPSDFPLPSNLSEQEREFAKTEIQHTLNGLWASTDCYWMSFPSKIREASWKMGQLKRASQLGFEIPRTLITNDPNEALGFYDMCNGKVIYKVMSDPFLGTGKTPYLAVNQEPTVPRATYTTLINEAELSMFDTVHTVPCQFQEYIDKKIELRVTVIGNEVFGAEIHSQAHQSTSVDWRNYDVTIPYQKADLPVEFTEKCINLVKSYGLNFSAMDFIVTDDKRFVFLENNPNGQFMFIEKLVPELKMTEALAACLIRGSNN